VSHDITQHGRARKEDTALGLGLRSVVAAECREIDVRSHDHSVAIFVTLTAEVGHIEHMMCGRPVT
jgi:hypothetical protein